VSFWQPENPLFLNSSILLMVIVNFLVKNVLNYYSPKVLGFLFRILKSCFILRVDKLYEFSYCTFNSIVDKYGLTNASFYVEYGGNIEFYLLAPSNKKIFYRTFKGVIFIAYGLYRSIDVLLIFELDIAVYILISFDKCICISSNYWYLR
jgi:hypothetical protein